MTHEKEYIEFFDSPVYAKYEVDGVKMFILQNRIFFVCVPQMRKIDMRIIQLGYDFLERNGGGLFYNIFSFKSFADVDPEVREWASNPDGNKMTISDAIVIGTLGQKILTDFYIKINAPVKPTKIFFSLEKAITWTEKQRLN